LDVSLQDGALSCGSICGSDVSTSGCPGVSNEIVDGTWNLNFKKNV
jgi:hypothetical protein